MTVEWSRIVPGLSALPQPAQRRLVDLAASISRQLPASSAEVYRVNHEVLSDLVEGVSARTDQGWELDAALDRTLADFGDVSAARAALVPLMQRATYRRRCARAGSVVGAFGFWWLALFAFGGAEPWSETHEPLIPSLSDGLASTALIIALVATVVVRIVIEIQRHIEPTRTSGWLRAAYLIEALSSGLSMVGLVVYTCYRQATAPHSLDLPPLIVALLLGVALMLSVRSDATFLRYPASLLGRGTRRG